MGNSMTKSELLAELYGRLPTFRERDCMDAAGVIIDTMSQILVEGGRIEIRGFGSFCLNYRPERLGRNPKSGESVVVPAKYVPHFKAGKEMRLRVDGAVQEA